ncbi:cytochrome b [Sphingomonas colocasiae]|uniref:Cytochrome b n=1 Tax=Sphingomonas colocasiae TaxID=1848973 RepID=A0ABS7PHP6_9SPHN|nr:cytochrome b [Sphingomonas colocasiae]MBY8820773.1 cytochrome b [Sphingomonas colocasiae]
MHGQAESPAARSTYSRVAIWLHWSIGLLVILNIAIVLVRENFEALSRTMMGWHKAIGILVLALSLVRIVWRLTHRPPPLPPMAAWEKGLSHLVHFLFYLFIIAIPLSGWLWMSAAETHRPISFFGLFIVPMLPVEQSKALAESFGEAHEIMGLATIGLIILHVAGALKHHFVDGTNLLERMIPGLRNR